jgi:hypothetical protein
LLPFSPFDFQENMRNGQTDGQAMEAYEAERKKVEDARAALPDVETLLSLDELQVSDLVHPLSSLKVFPSIYLCQIFDEQGVKKGKNQRQERQIERRKS